MKILSICWSAVEEMAIGFGIAAITVIVIFGTLFLVFSENKTRRIIGYCLAIICIIAYILGLYFFLASNCQ